MKKYICLFMILTTLISAFFIGCQKNTNQLEKVDIIVNSENETIDKNTNSVSVNFTVNNNSNKYIVVSYFDDVYGESYLTVDEAPYTIIEPQSTNPDFGYGYEYSNQKEYEEIISKINKEYHPKQAYCQKNIYFFHTREGTFPASSIISNTSMAAIASTTGTARGTTHGS